jgi:hypothetical protein
MTTRVFISVIAVTVLLGCRPVFAQDDTITNACQFVELLDQCGLDYPLVDVAEPPMFVPTIEPLYCDFDQLTNAIGDVRNRTGSVQDGVNVWPVRLTRTASGTAITYPYTDTVLLNLPAAEDDDFETRYENVLRSFCFLMGRNPTSYDDLIAEGFGFLAPTKRIVLDVWLADVNDYPLASGMMAASDTCDSCDDPPPDPDPEFMVFDPNGPPCSTVRFNKFKISTNNNFVLEWFSQTNATYEIASATDITSTNWISLASLYPASSSNLTSFTDVGAATNVAKFYKVVQTGISVQMCDSNTVTGVLSVPVEIGIPTNQMLSGVTFLVDDDGSRAMIDPQPPFTSRPSGTFDTTLVTNGWHTIQAIATYPSSVVGVGGYQVYTSQVVVVRTQNHVTFPDMLFTWGDKLNVRATLDTLITNWSANIWAGDYVEGSSNHLLRSYSGITSNGQIDFVWDGKDSNGVTFAAGVFTNVTFLIDDPVGRPVWREGSLAMPNFLVSYMPLQGEFSPGDLNFIDMISQIAGYVSAAEPLYVLNTSGTGISSTWNITDTAPGWLSWAHEVASNQTANLYYFGHTSENALGNRPSNANSGYYIEELEIITGNTVVPGKGFWKGKIAKFTLPFHFVFLDGCSSAKGNWCEAFGIERVKTTQAGYTTNGLPPKAFLGWKKDMPYAVGAAFSTEHRDFVIDFFGDWSAGAGNTGLQAAINQNTRASFIPLIRIWGAQDLRWNSP